MLTMIKPSAELCHSIWNYSVLYWQCVLSKLYWRCL